MSKFLGSSVAVGLTSLLIACGGGGGDAVVDTTPYPVQQALSAAYTDGLQATLSVTGSATDGVSTYPVSGTMTLTLSPATSTTINGAPALQVNETVSGMLTVNGQSGPLNASSTAYMTPSFEPLAFSTDGSYCEAQAPIVLPETLTVGQSGTVGTFLCYTDVSKTVPIGSETETYTTSSGSLPNTLTMRLVTNVYDSSHIQTTTGSISYEITRDGMASLNRFVMTVTDMGVTVTLTAQLAGTT